MPRTSDVPAGVTVTKVECQAGMVKFYFLARHEKLGVQYRGDTEEEALAQMRAYLESLEE